MTRALRYYRVMSVVVGTALLVLCVGVVLRYGFGHPTLEKVVGPIHGVLYIVYLVSVVNLALAAHLRKWQVVAMVAAGFVPFLAFYVENRVTASLASQAEVQPQEAP
jgi:integral membrane protein